MTADDVEMKEEGKDAKKQEETKEKTPEELNKINYEGLLNIFILVACLLASEMIPHLL